MPQDRAEGSRGSAAGLPISTGGRDLPVLEVLQRLSRSYAAQPYRFELSCEVTVTRALNYHPQHAQQWDSLSP